MLPKPHKHHNGVLAILLISCLALLIVLFGLLAIDFTANSIAPVGIETRTLDDNQRTVNDSDTEDNLEKSEISTSTFSQNDSLPTFDYPSNWHISIRDYSFESTITTVLQMDSTPIYYCEGCDGQVYPITIASYDAANFLGNHESFDAYVHQTYEDSLYYKNVTIESPDENTYLVVGTQIEFFEGDFETIYKLVDDILIIISLSVDDLDRATTYEAWDIVSSSLDFSTVN